MTAPTSDRAQRAKGIAALSRRCRGAMFSHNGDDLAAAIVAYVDTLAPDTERLGGGERETKAEKAAKPVMPIHSEYVRHEQRLFDVLAKHVPAMPMTDDLIGDAVKTLDNLVAERDEARALCSEAQEFTRKAQERAGDSLTRLHVMQCRAEAAEKAVATLAQTAKDATARAEAAERANVEVDNARKSAEQSARDLRAENARLRAQLDAMTGEQKPWAYDVKGWGIFRCKDEQTLEKELQHAAKMTYRTDFQPIPLYRHPSPAARVVGACVVRDGDVCGIWCANHWGDQRAKERKAWESARRDGGTPHRLHCSVDEIAPALTPTTDGAQ